jgi:hypothetical protein
MWDKQFKNKIRKKKLKSHNILHVCFWKRYIKTATYICFVYMHTGEGGARRRR